MDGDSGAVGGYDVEAYWGVGVCDGVDVGEDCVAEFLWNGEEGSWVWSGGFAGFWWNGWRIGMVGEYECTSDLDVAGEPAVGQDTVGRALDERCANL